MARVKFLKTNPQNFLEKVQNKTELSFRELADICKVHRYKDKVYRNCAMNFTNRSIPALLFFKEKLYQFGFHPTRNTKFSIFLRRENEIKKYFQEVGCSSPKHLNKFKEFFKEKYGEVPKWS